MMSNQSDQNNTPRMRPLRSGGKIFWHPCSVCGDQVAPFGVGVDTTRNKMGQWFCRDHVPDDYFEAKA